MPLFGKSPTPKEQMRKQDRALRSTNRDIDKDRRELERREKQLESEIKKAAQAGNKQACTVLAKQLVQLRKQKTRTYTMQSRVSAVGAQGKAMSSNMAMANAMSTTTKTMQGMNKTMDPMKVAKTMKEFEMANTKMEMSEEMINDTLDDILTESGDEEEEDAIVTQVLDEIGIEMTGKVAAAPTAGKGQLGELSKAEVTDADIERQLAQLMKS
ncbi:PREDICTED: charged multivesicular body protein 2b-like [Priapulus caudatus]|uniref:Charged multivesicular body protein 2b-like n=1 Tax=Priapulus caudatus TaxID=37621 RepID=A0ABM1ET45_PRICU|nr:PREDICTED: charged multivesicular body protein 2b-like [Priapulus caudatus]